LSEATGRRPGVMPVSGHGRRGVTGRRDGQAGQAADRGLLLSFPEPSSTFAASASSVGSCSIFGGRPCARRGALDPDLHSLLACHWAPPSKPWRSAMKASRSDREIRASRPRRLTAPLPSVWNPLFHVGRRLNSGVRRAPGIAIRWHHLPPGGVANWRHGGYSAPVSRIIAVVGATRNVGLGTVVPTALWLQSGSDQRFSDSALY
jgi:hypothetical protein